MPPFKAETMPVDEDNYVFVLSVNNAANVSMKIKKTDTLMRDCAQEEDMSSPADAVRYIDSQELYMIQSGGGFTSHRFVVGHLLEC